LVIGGLIYYQVAITGRRFGKKRDTVSAAATTAG
jgi:hypothetical protein